jgi:multiple sugar transport system ATP-binding protein
VVFWTVAVRRLRRDSERTVSDFIYPAARKPSFQHFFFAPDQIPPGDREGQKGLKMATIDIKAIWKAYGTHPVIFGIDFAIPDGAFVVLVGPSGCGKSTLLRMIAGLEDISSGEILIDGTVVNDMPPKDRDIAMVFQNYALYPHLTVKENMAFSLRLRKEKRATVNERVNRAAEILGLMPLLDRYPKALSGGQRQRVAMGRAIVRDASVFLFDEPLSNLDAKLRVQMRTELKALHQRLKTTTVYVTHDQIEAMTMADIIVVMQEGVIMQLGTPLELYDQPANRFVAGFIGSPAMNFFEGRIEAGAFLTESGLELPLPDMGDGSPVGTVTYGIRPEHFTFDDAGVPARVQVIEPTGSETQILADIGGQEVLAVFRERHALKPGDEIRLLPDAKQAHLFNSEDGDRI